MKIGILGTRGIPNYYGGFEQFAEYFATYVANQNHEIFVYNSHKHPYKESNFKGVQIIHCYDPEYIIGTAGQYIYDLNCILDARKRNFDIILQFNTLKSFLGLYHEIGDYFQYFLNEGILFSGRFNHRPNPVVSFQNFIFSIQK